MTDAPKGRFTFRFAAVCFALSAAWEMTSLHEATPLFGQMIGVPGAVVYHLLYIAMFAGLALGLWTAQRFGYYLLFAASLLYTVDRLQLFVGDTLMTQLRHALGGNEDLLAQLGTSFLLQMLTLTITLLVLSWWGFAAYAYVRRDYFGIGKRQEG